MRRGVRERFYAIPRRKKATMASTVKVEVDPASLALIEQVAAALGHAGLANYIDDLCERRAFTEALSSRWEKGVLVVGLGPYTELLLREMIDVAQRPGWSNPARGRWIEHAIEIAGFGG